VWPYDGHFAQRVVELPSAITAHFVAASLDGEDAAQIRMMATKGEIERNGKRMYESVPTAKRFGHSQIT